MTTTISPYDYCKHPEDYINSPGLDNITRAYWDQYCALLNASQGPPITNSSSGWDKFKNVVDGIANGSSTIVENLIIGLVTMPIQNVPFTSVPMWQSVIPGFWAPEVIKYIIANPLKWLSEQGISKAGEEAAVEMVSMGASKSIVNQALVSRSVVEGIIEESGEKIAEDATYSAGEYAIGAMLRAAAGLIADGLIEIAGALEVVIEVLDPVMWAMFIVQVMGMIFDMWDPCNLNMALDADALQTFSNSFNQQFLETMLANFSATRDSYGHLMYNAEYPVQYYAEQSALLPLKQDYYNKIYWKLYFQYLTTLTHNSDGYPIYKTGGGTLITGEQLSGWASRDLGFFANNNTVVENWLVKWWPIIGGILILIIVLFIVIKIKNVKKG
jgi:hypothetical protein